MSGVTLCHHFAILRYDVSLKLEIRGQEDGLDSKLQRSSCLCLPSAGPTSLACPMGAEDSNSSHQACTTGALPAEPHSPSPGSFFPK